MIGQRLACAHPVPERRSKPHPTQLVKCPRCDSFDTKFCYYNNYSLTQPRYFCKSCKRYWTDGGALRNVPVGGGLRKNKRCKQKAPGQSDTAAKAPVPAISDTFSNEKSHQDSPNASGPQDAPNFRYSNSPLDEKYSYESRRAQQRLYVEAGEHFNYGEAKNVPQFFPGYSYSMAMEGGVPHYEGGYAGYNLSGPASSEQAQSNSGEMSDVLEATPREALEPSSSNQELHYGAIPQQTQPPQQHHRHSHIQEGSIDSRRSSSPYTKSSLPATSELLQSSKSANGVGVQELRSDEPSNNGVINPYDWQAISEGLFGGNGDYLYMPGTWPDLSHFDSGPG